eukprot:12787905-Heterocapsa_arctica.AAC.1
MSGFWTKQIFRNDNRSQWLRQGKYQDELMSHWPVVMVTACRWFRLSFEPTPCKGAVPFYVVPDGVCRFSIVLPFLPTPFLISSSPGNQACGSGSSRNGLQRTELVWVMWREALVNK